MRGLLDVVDGGIGNSIQDLGRRGFRHMGIALSGALDTTLARCANALVGNAPDAAVVEIRAVGPKLSLRQGRVRCALAGDIAATVKRADGSALAVPAWTSVTLDLHDQIEVETLPGGAAYLAVSGGVATPLALGSRSTYPRALIGGVDGKMLAAGQVLPCTAATRPDYREYAGTPWRHDDGPIRLILGPQDDHFRADSIEAFLSSEYQVTPQLDRMGIRLEGASLAHVGAQAADIVSDGVTPGTIQVPGNGQPIILLADCQTVGGYPKIATVISADLPRLGQLQPRQAVRFSAISLAEARQARLAAEARWAAWARDVRCEVWNLAAVADDASGVWFSDN